MFIKYSRLFVLALALATMVTPTAFGKTKTGSKCVKDCTTQYETQAQKECGKKKGKEWKVCMLDAKEQKKTCISACRK